MRSRKNRGEKGQSMVEMALAFPVIVLILSGLVDIGRVYFAYIYLEEAAAEAALFLAISGDCANASPGAQCNAPNNAEWRANNSGSRQGVVAPNAITIDPTVNSPANPAVGDVVEIEATYPFEFVTPGISAIAEGVTGGAGLTLRVTATHLVFTED
jgi:Flp pilus assembly protein TadG